MKRTSAAIVTAAGLIAALALPAHASPGGPAAASTPSAVVPVGHGTPAEGAASVRALMPAEVAGRAAGPVELVGLSLTCTGDTPSRPVMWVTYRNNTDQPQQATFAFTPFNREPTQSESFSSVVPAGEQKPAGYYMGNGDTYRFWDLTVNPRFHTMVSIFDCAKGAPFTDSDYFEHQFGMQIDWMYQQSISTGWPETNGTRTYRGLQPMARDAMAAFLYRLYGSPAFTPPAQPTFRDVSTSNQFYKQIEWLASVGITTGWDVAGTKEFRPLNPVNRDAMAAFLYRFSVLEGFPAYTPAPGAETFVDVPVGMTHYAAMMWMKDSGISTGWAAADGREYRPLTPVARDALAAFVFRYTDRTALGSRG